MAEVKKTAKYYRDILAGGDIYKSVSVLAEVIKKFGYEDTYYDYKKKKDVKMGRWYIYIKPYTKFEWNHKIDKLIYNKKENKVYAEIYWQGDSTDGSTWEEVNAIKYGKVIPAEWDKVGGIYGMVERHSPLRIEKEEFVDALKAVTKYLSPEEMKARKIRDKRNEVSKKVYDYIDGKKADLERWEFEGFWNGRWAVQKVLEGNPELLDKDWEVLKPIVEKVWENNNKSDYSLRGGWCSGEKKYNLAY